jgi:hypothetical protein
MAEISSHVYDTLKHQVQQLKIEQQTLAGQRAKQKEVCTSGCRLVATSATCCQHASTRLGCCLLLFRDVQFETSALLQQKLQYEDQLQSSKQEVCSLQQRLKENVERASRVRQHAERCVACSAD